MASPASPTRVLFVCLGNICRSPLAEGLFRHHVEQAGLQEHFHIDSAGTGNWHVGELPDPRMRQTASSHGLQLNMRARQIEAQDLHSFHYVVCMDSTNLGNVEALVQGGDHPAKLVMMRTYDPAGTGDVPDPYFGGPEGFEQVYDMLNRSTQLLLMQLTATAK